MIVRLWVDALCINQSDLEERAQQVLRMREIYAKAKYTLVWLGPEADNSSAAMAMVGSFSVIVELFQHVHLSMEGPPSMRRCGRPLRICFIDLGSLAPGLSGSLGTKDGICAMWRCPINAKATGQCVRGWDPFLTKFVELVRISETAAKFG